MSTMKNGLKALYGSKLGKILPVLVIAGLVATASAAVFVNYYATGAVTAQSNDVSLVVGADNSASCTGVTPCAHVTSAGDFATIALNLGNESSNSPQPQTFFTDVLQVHYSGATSRTVSVNITSATETGTFYGSLTVYYCTQATSNPANDPTHCTGTAITSNISSSTAVVTGKTLSSGGSDGYVAIVGWAATSGSSLSFDLQFQWA
jgi:hypothetical protein